MTDTVIIVVPTNARILERRAVLTLRHVSVVIPSVHILTSIKSVMCEKQDDDNYTAVLIEVKE